MCTVISGELFSLLAAFRVFRVCCVRVFHSHTCKCDVFPFPGRCLRLFCIFLNRISNLVFVAFSALGFRCVVLAFLRFVCSSACETHAEMTRSTT